MIILTINGLYNWDNTLFDGFSPPEGLDKDTSISYIMMRGSDYSLIYPDFYLMKQLIKTWSDGHQHKWTKLSDTMKLVYDPIENYNRYEKWTDTREAETKTNRTVTGSADGNNTSNGTNKLDVSAYDEGGEYSPKDLTTVSDTLTSHDSATTTDNGTASDNDNATHEGHLYGNIGVTTSQNMIQQERDISNFNLYEIIANDFVKEFCIMVY